jgi:hypothetical protein
MLSALQRYHTEHIPSTDRLTYDTHTREATVRVWFLRLVAWLLDRIIPDLGRE